MRAYRSSNAHVLRINEIETGVFAVHGDLTFASIDQNTTKQIDFAGKDSCVQVDLKEVAKIDSAGLALMIEWIKIGKKNNCRLLFMHIPLQLQALANISGFDLNLPLTSKT